MSQLHSTCVQQLDQLKKQINSLKAENASLNQILDGRNEEITQLVSINSQEEVFNRNDPNTFVSIVSFEINLKINFQLNSLIRSYFQ